MLTFHIVRMLAISTLFSLALTACAGGLDAPYPIVKKVPPGQGLINFQDPIFKNAKVVRISDLLPFEHVEYARFETPNLTLEVVYDIAVNNSIVLQYDYWMKKMVDTWYANQGQAKNWGVKQSVRAWHGEVDFQPYRLDNSRRDCIGFSSEWDFQARDSLGRPTKVLFGYVCAKPGVKLSEPRIAALLKSVKISQRFGSSFVPVDARRSVDQVAFNTAKGSLASGTGNAKFPFNFGTTYFEGDTRFN